MNSIRREVAVKGTTLCELRTPPRLDLARIGSTSVTRERHTLPTWWRYWSVSESHSRHHQQFQNLLKSPFSEVKILSLTEVGPWEGVRVELH
eukprot:713843-Amphidinium_carterae.1